MTKHTPPLPVEQADELNSELQMAIKQLFLDGIAWGRTNPYGTTIPEPSEIPTLGEVRRLLAAQATAAQERAVLEAKFEGAIEEATEIFKHLNSKITDREAWELVKNLLDQRVAVHKDRIAQLRAAQPKEGKQL